jgi:hypothetical protein
VPYGFPWATDHVPRAVMEPGRGYFGLGGLG